MLHRGRICCKYDIYAVYAAFAAYGWDPRAEVIGPVEGKMLLAGPTIHLSNNLQADLKTSDIRL